MAELNSSVGRGFRIYPRGFLGANVIPQTERTNRPFTDIQKRLQYQTNNEASVQARKNKGPDANSHVEVLYAEMAKGNTKWQSFEFRREILLTALEAFGTQSFSTWYNSQHQVTACGDMHNRFLTDTLRFIATGRREMVLSSWAELLVMTDEGNCIGPVSDYASQFFKQGERHLLRNVIHEWCLQPNGINDLLVTMHILFGNP